MSPSLRRAALASATATTAVAAMLLSPATAVAYGPFVTDSPSSVTVSGRGAEATVLYTNRSTEKLRYDGFVGEPSLVRKIYDSWRTGDPEWMPLLDSIDVQKDEGLVSELLLLDESRTAPGTTFEVPRKYGNTLTDTSFAPAAVVECRRSNGTWELETTVVGGPPGSLDAGLSGIGSSGSLGS